MLNPNLLETAALKTPNQPLISSKILLSLATSPFLLSAIAAQSLVQTLIEVGQASEEVFRGDRLPVLPVPDSEIEQ